MLARGLDRKQFSKFPQAWCLQGGWGLTAISDDLIGLLRAPDELLHVQVDLYTHSAQQRSQTVCLQRSILSCRESLSLSPSQPQRGRCRQSKRQGSQKS